MGLLVWYSARNAFKMNGSEAMAITGNIVSFILLLNLLFRPLRVIADKFNVLQMGMVAGERVFVVLDNKDHLSDLPEATSRVIKGNITFEHVGFHYNEGHPVLKDISFKLQEGETLAIVGHTGSGKSTIIGLLNRLYQHQEGRISIDDQPIESITLSSLRKQIGVVLQDVYLFSGSVFENITLRDPSITMDQVVAAAKMIGIHDFILQLPGGYDYDVMERGGTLSLGQRQLLSFIRALLFKPAILVLDEATSSVDSQTEQLIQHAIDVLTAGRTSIIIAHRLSTVRKATQILLLDKGEIKESGTHEQLIKLGGSYAKLKLLQDHKQ
jgi:ATP-binding cassette subfamily B protein